MTPTVERPPRVQRIWKALLVGIGLVNVGLAVAGIVLPLVPTTPFLLLAAFCFAKSSERWHQWLLTHRWLGPYIINWRKKRGLTPAQVWVTVGVLWASVVFTVLRVEVPWWLLAVFISGGTVMTVLLFRKMRRRGDDGSA